MTYRIRNLRTGLFFAGVDPDMLVSEWCFAGNAMAVPIDYPTPMLAADAVAQYDLDPVEIVEVAS